MNTSEKLMPIICILLVSTIILFIVFQVQGMKRDREYNQNIKRANDKITELEQGIVNQEDVARVLKEAADAAKLNADNRIAELEESEKLRKARYARELRELKAEIATMPPDEIVTETRVELGRQDIYRLPDGVKFSIEASRANLGILSKFSLVEHDRDKIKANLDKCLLAAVDYDESVLGFKAVIASKDKIIFNKDGIIASERGKFRDCEKNKRRKWFDGAIKGSLGTLAVVVFFKILGGK